MTLNNEITFDPYLDIELRNKETATKSNKGHKQRRIYKRNIPLALIYTILTFGIYGIFWQFEIAKETNAICDDDSGFSPF